MKFTIITVCYNAEKVIQATIESVLNQTYPTIEYILVDGGSDDSTLDIIKRIFADYNHHNDMVIKMVSEPDNGLYDAMNKGVGMATGDYIYFLNAGDIFADVNVIENISTCANPNQKEILFGHVIYSYPDNTRVLRKYGKWCAKPMYYLTGDSINHQCIFASRSCFDIFKFDAERFKVCADREWMMSMMKEKIPFVATDISICIYSLDENSVSIVNSDIQWKEAEWCIKEHFKWGTPIFHFFMFFREHKGLADVLHSFYERIFLEEYNK